MSESDTKDESYPGLTEVLRQHGLLAELSHQREWMMVMGGDLARLHAFFLADGALIKQAVKDGVWREKGAFEQHTCALELAMGQLRKQS